MACNLTIGRKEPCRENYAGIKAVYFVDYEDDLLDSATFDADDQITGFGTAQTWYKYETREIGHTFTQAYTVSPENGTRSCTQTLNITLKVQNNTSRKEFKLLTAASPHIVVEDYNGNFQYAGIENGFVVSITAEHGDNPNDLYGYRIEAVAMEKNLAHYVDPTIVDDSGTNTTVTEGT